MSRTPHSHDDDEPCAPGCPWNDYLNTVGGPNPAPHPDDAV